MSCRDVALCLAVLAGALPHRSALAADPGDSGGASANTASGASAGTGTGTGTGTGPLAGAGNGGPIGATPSVLSATGIGAATPDVRLGNLANQMPGGLGRGLGGGVPNAPGGQRAWTITPQIGLTQEYTTSGIQAGGTGRTGGQFITTLAPSLAINGASTRVTADLFYAPNLAFYQPQGSQNRVSQNFNGRILAILLPGTLFLDLRGTAATQTVTAGNGPIGTTTPARGNLSQTTSFSASPYALHRFGPWGTGEIGGILARTTQNALQQTGPQTATQQALGALAAASNQNVTTYGGHVAFTTGEAFARYSGAALAQTLNFNGQGVLSNAYRNTITLDSGYGITRTITALAKIGYENIRYSGTAPRRINDAIWSVGTRLEPNPESTVTVRYGHQDGFDSWQVDGSVQTSPRTRLFARYSSGLTTQAEALQNALATSDLDTQGNPVDHITGAPLVPVGNFFGSQSNLNKTTVASLTAVLIVGERDTVSASVTSQTQQLVSAGNAVGLAQGNTSGVYGTLNWSHEIRPDLVGTVFGQYGTNHTSGVAGSRQQSVTASGSLSYALTSTIAGQVQYTYSRTYGATQTQAQTQGAQRGLTATPNADQSIVLLSLAKSF